ncbi:oligopeptide/dipeptide ABC transporter, permease protein [Saccharopolyspora erythraea NRRL 2338]|uniref:Oligopeptide/dipeptide ABC transporter, permease protein n=1 Tax=Saccharopolyspora erythraea (strain ATCC 11635 / DSM 40517 / JCM 4748 / NBRC 13426 / NCIMB 8594 / NRRL 2338) TaxID=405948 RepID=A4F976_SACEN|nr:oligopeptide/dipeptide ABC transporter, permease protein [Saccharopolyspora erythraea NRRL 2338]
MLRRLVRHRTGVVGLVLSAALVLAAVAVPLIAPTDPAAVDFNRVLQQPSASAWLGTDELGRDQLSRVLHGIRASLTVGVLSVLLALVVSVPLGLVAGYYRGVVDSVVSRITDTLLAFPFLVLAVGLAAVLGASLLNAAIAIGVSQVPNLIRVVRGETLRLSSEAYVDAAVAAGARGGAVLFGHVLPNAVNALLVQITVAIPAAIIGEALLSFLGLGVQPPSPSLGVMLSAAQTYFAQAPWLVVFPGLAVVLATLGFNLLGDGLRDALDPKGNR